MTTSNQVGKTLSLLCPLNGDFIPLENVPDPAFAEKMVGDGAAIDPVEGKLVAPCDGEITLVHPSCHAVSIATEQGIELLMHIGVDTVKLRGEGFDVKVEVGQQVKAGELLIEFDLDAVALQAASLITPILVTDTDSVGRIRIESAAQTEIGNAFFSAELKQAGEKTFEQFDAVRSQPVKVMNVTGIHARPAAHLAQIAKGFGSDITLLAGQRQTNARSVVGLMGMNIGFADEVVFEARGDDADQAISALVAAVNSGLGEEVQQLAETPLSSVTEEPSLLFPSTDDDNELHGISASPGHATGNIVIIENSGFEYPDTAADPGAEKSRLQQARQDCQTALQQLVSSLEQQGNKDKQEIMQAHLELLDDPALEQAAVEQIDQGQSAEAAWQAAIDTQVTVLEGLANPLMQQRAVDLKDVGVRVIRELLGLEGDPLANLPTNAVIVASEFTPSEVAGLNPQQVAALLTTTGSATSHAAILARSQKIPMIAGLSNSLLSFAAGDKVLVDASAGKVIHNPSQQQLDELTAQQQKDEALQQAAAGQATQPALTADGVEIEVAANLGDVNDAGKAAQSGADGVGLLRSEFLYLQRVNEPDEESQFEAYSTLLAGIGKDKPVIVRTLDVGGDKPLPYVDIGKEDNPFLGERGIRICLDRPRLLRTQLRALLRAGQGSQLKIMLPMISSLKELQLARQVMDQECESLGCEPLPLGVMIEVPSAALMADVLAREADFFSIGTNDLTQYTMAVDRGNARLAPLADNLDPAVLRMIDNTVRGASQHQRWVGVCGGMAGEPLAQPLLLGLGVNELSVSVSAVAETKHRVRGLNLSACQALAQQALKASSATEVHALVSDYLAQTNSPL